MSNPIVRYVQKQLFAQKGMIANKKAVDFSAAKMAERLSEFGFDPRLIQDEKQLVQILNLIKEAEDQAFAQKFKGILAPKKSAKVFSLKDKKEIPNPERNIMGGQAFETEEEIAKRIAKDNKEGISRIRERQKMIDNAIDNQSPAFSGDRKVDAALVAEEMAERMGKVYDDLSQKEQSKLYGEAFDALSKKRFDEDLATGGRVGFKMGRRAFLKALGAGIGGAAALKTGIIGLSGKKAVTEAGEKIITAPVKGKPEWFDALVNKVIREGEDVTKQFGYKDRMQVNTKQISPTEEVTVYRDLDDGSVRVNYGAKLRIDNTKPYERGNIQRASNEPDQIDLIVREGEVIEPDLTTGKGGGKTKASFEASEAEPRAVGGPEDADIEFDGIREVDNVDDLMQDISSLEEYATGKKLTGIKAAKAKKKREDYQKFTEDQVEQAEYLEQKYGPYDDSAADDFASGGLAGMLGQ